MGAKANPYNRKNDLKQSTKGTQGLTGLERASFEKAEDKHPRVKTPSAGKKIDQKIVAKIKAKRK